MKIAVNTRLLRAGQMDGIGWFTYNTLKYITQNNPGIEFHFLFDSGIDERFLFSPNIVPHNLFPPAKHAVLNVLWFEWSAKRFLNKLSPNLFLSPDGILSLGWKGAQYGIVHDINFHHIPQDLKWSNRTYYNYFFPKYVERANRIATVSSYSKEDIVKTYGTDPGKIDVVYCGINDFFAPVPPAEQQAIKAQYAGGADYFVFVGTLHPRKNIIRLMQAFDLFKQRTGAPVKLVLAGKEMYKTGEMHECKEQLASKQDIVFTGRLPDNDLKKLLGASLALTFVPYFEGFGIPPLEAMQCDVPVIAANATSIPEVVGDAALLVDPYQVADIATAMEQLWEQPALRAQLIAKGQQQKNVFSWERTARLLWEGIGKVL
ncbi:glycosyltransferase family 4 protein [Paraflavitalea pollutisoli]|uniref:glycosyltransferase family 4 protein n=1 Tax=Paraflavitalea pollutisoli TaxID=3034143 RepID=UPI0023ECB64C|nr:glycosyltransferase family 1 protein [Paraflavitalea sp. H1-2-19X]